MSHGSSVPHLAHRLNVLFEHVQRPDSTGPWTNEAVAEALAERGCPVSAPYLSTMRTGKKANPSAWLLANIAAHFRVPIAYFFEELTYRAVLKDLRLLAAAGSDPGVTNAGLELAPETREHVSWLINHLAALEAQRPPDSPDSPPFRG